MRSIRVGVVEDDAASRAIVLEYLKRYTQECDVQFATAVFESGTSFINQYSPVYDVLLLDIEMPGLNGMEIAREVRESDESVIIVFITAAPQYAISGYQVQALSYLLKPVPWFAFKQEMKRSIDMIQQRGGESMLVETRAQQLRLELSNVVFLESIRHTIVIHTLDGKLSITSTLKELETQLAQQGFFRSNACYLVNLRHVQAIEDQECIMSNGEHLRVSRPRKKMFLAALADFLGAASR